MILADFQICISVPLKCASVIFNAILDSFSVAVSLHAFKTKQTQPVTACSKLTTETF